MENPLKIGEYLNSTSPNHAKEFTYRQAINLLKAKSKKLSWIKSYYMVSVETGDVKECNLNYQGKAGIYKGENAVEIDEHLLDEIITESKNILNLSGWNINKLEVYHSNLQSNLSQLDSAESDIVHAIQIYSDVHNGKKPPANKMAKVGYILEDIRCRRAKVKQCLDYLSVMKDAASYKYDISTLKEQLEKARHQTYQGRTNYYDMVMKILE